MKKFLLLLPLAALLSCKKTSTVAPQTGSSSISGGSTSAGGTTTGGSTTTTPAKVLLTQESISVTDPTFGNSKYDINYVYDANGVLIKRTDDGSEQPLTYNASGQLASVGKAGPDQDVFTFTYDAAGNLTDATENNYNTDGKLERTQYFKYNVSAGHVMQTTVYNAARTVTGTYNYTYSGDNITQETFKDGKGTLVFTTIYTYGTNFNPKYNARYKFYFDPISSVDDVSANEPLTSKTTAGTIVTTDTYQYTYTKNYPVASTLTITYSNDPKATLTATEKYTYSGL